MIDNGDNRQQLVLLHSEVVIFHLFTGCFQPRHPSLLQKIVKNVLINALFYIIYYASISPFCQVLSYFFLLYLGFFVPIDKDFP